MDHYQSWTDLSITEVVWDRLDREQKKGANIQRRALKVLRNDMKASLREFALC